MYAITAHDRALIDQAIAAGAVRHIPPGVSGIDLETGQPWPTVEAAIEAHRVRQEEIAHRLRMVAEKAAASRRRGRGRLPMTPEVNRKIIQMWRSGATLAAVAYALDVSATSAIYRRFEMLKPGHRWKRGRWG